MFEKGLSDEANEMKYKRYVNRVNEAVRKIVNERKELVKRNN